jgi:hypothetical protein
MRRIERGNRVEIPSALLPRLQNFIDQNRPLKNLVTRTGLTRRWLEFIVQGVPRRYDVTLLQCLCAEAGIDGSQYGLPNARKVSPYADETNVFQFVPAERQHLEWVGTNIASVYQDTEPLERRLKWWNWNRRGYRAVLNAGRQCGILEILSVRDDRMSELVLGRITESGLDAEHHFAVPRWPAKNLLIQNFMVLDLDTMGPEESVFAVRSWMFALPDILRECGDPEVTTVYTSPFHSNDQNAKFPPRTARFIQRMGFELVPPAKPLEYPFYRNSLRNLLQTVTRMNNMLWS